MVLSSWKAYAVSLETASRDTQTLNLSQNVSKFYERQVASDDRAAKPKFVALSQPALYYSGQQVYRFSGNRDSEGESFCIEYIVAAFKAAI